MPTKLRELTERRKENLLRAGVGRNSIHATGAKPSGPYYAGYEEGGKLLAPFGHPVASILGGALIGGMGAFRLVRGRAGIKLVDVLLALAGARFIYKGISDILHPRD